MSRPSCEGVCQCGENRATVAKPIENAPSFPNPNHACRGISGWGSRPLCYGVCGDKVTFRGETNPRRHVMVTGSSIGFSFYEEALAPLSPPFRFVFCFSPSVPRAYFSALFAKERIFFLLSPTIHVKWMAREFVGVGRMTGPCGWIEVVLSFFQFFPPFSLLPMHPCSFCLQSGTPS